VLAAADPRRGPAPPAGPSEMSASDASPGHERPGNSICIIDDDHWVCDSLIALLESYGFAALGYSSGSAFLADQTHREAKCLVVDQHMPGLDGLDVIAALRREGTPVPAVLITGRLDAGIAERARQLGVLAVLEKPFPVAQLVGLIRAGLEGHDFG